MRISIKDQMQYANNSINTKGQSLRLDAKSKNSTKNKRANRFRNYATFFSF